VIGGPLRWYMELQRESNLHIAFGTIYWNMELQLS